MGSDYILGGCAGVRTNTANRLSVGGHMVTAGGPSVRVLAVGVSCPAGLAEAIRTDFKRAVHIVRSLHATCSCFISQCSIKVPGFEGTSAQAVVKSYTKAKLDQTELQQVELEIRLHHKLTDKHAVPFWIAVEDSSQIHIISKYCPRGDLRQQITAGCMSEATVRDQVIQPLLHVLQHMHAQGIVHRDLKPENIFLADGHVLLGDFGLAVAVPRQQTYAPHNNSEAAAGSRTNGCSMDICCSNRHCSTVDYQARCSSAESAACSHTVNGSAHVSHALKRASSSSSNLPDLALDHSSSCSCSTAVSSPGRRTSGSRIKRSSSAGCAGAWGCSALPQLPISTAGGTPAYSAPEVVLAAFSSGPAAPAVGPQNDIWALGVLALECLTGQHPFGDPDMSPYAFMFSIIGDKQLPIQHLPLSTACTDWLTQVLQKDPSMRPTAARLLQHQWIQGGLPTEQAGSVVGNTIHQLASPGPSLQEAYQLEQQGQHKEPMRLVQHAEAPVKRSGMLGDQLLADLLKLSGLTEAETATKIPFSSGPRGLCASSWCGGMETAKADAASIWSRSCKAAAGTVDTEAAVIPSLSDIGSKDWCTTKQAGDMDEGNTATLPCRLQQHSSCPSSAIMMSEPQQRPSVTLRILDSIGSWED